MYNNDYRELTYGRGYVYNIQYHIVWCTKYRKPVLRDDVESQVKQDIKKIANELGFSVVAMECMPDHIHLLVKCSPQHFIPTIIKILKGNTARHLFMAYPELKNCLWQGKLWNPSYFVATVSDNTKEQIESYILSQRVK